MRLRLRFIDVKTDGSRLGEASFTRDRNRRLTTQSKKEGGYGVRTLGGTKRRQHQNMHTLGHCKGWDLQKDRLGSDISWSKHEGTSTDLIGMNLHLFSEHECVCGMVPTYLSSGLKATLINEYTSFINLSVHRTIHLA